MTMRDLAEVYGEGRTDLRCDFFPVRICREREGVDYRDVLSLSQVNTNKSIIKNSYKKS